MKIKICGVTNPADVALLNEAHVDFAGMVLFFPKSKRNLTIEKAKELMPLFDNSIKKVAVVVSPTPEQLSEIESAGFDYIQIHGTLQPEVLENIHIPVLKAFNVTDMDNYPLYRDCPQIVGYVFDALTPGSGQTFDWNLVTDLPRDNKLLLLAGGLNADNVSSAIAALHPDGVDVSSAVEYTDRLGKDPAKVRTFVAAVRNS